MVLGGRRRYRQDEVRPQGTVDHGQQDAHLGPDHPVARGGLRRRGKRLRRCGVGEEPERSHPANQLGGSRPGGAVVPSSDA